MFIQWEQPLLINYDNDMENDKIYTFPNTEEVREAAIKTLESLLNMHKGTMFGHVLSLFIVPALLTETDMSKVLERLETINKVLRESFSSKF